jgi:tRNA(Arg) A34 adenosine deaminase TadA
MDATEFDHLARAVALARDARERGDHPFGALLVTADGRVVEALNSVNTENDPTGHAETNLVRLAASSVEVEALASSTLFTSTEPCAMCAGAIYWSGIGRVVFALSEQGLAELVGDADEPTLDLPCREVFARGGRPIEVIGPVDLPDAVAVHEGFWN